MAQILGAYLENVRDLVMWLDFDEASLIVRCDVKDGLVEENVARRAFWQVFGKDLPM